MSTIDWDVINGTRERRADAEDETPDLGQFTQEDIDAALAKVAALPAIDPSDEDTVATFWPLPKKMWTLADLDFRGVTVTEVTLADLFATNDNLSRSKLEEHVESPGQAHEESPFGKYPIIFQSKKKQTIIDGQHRLAALMLLGATSWPVYLVPK